MEEKKQGLRMILIICGVTAAVLLICLLILISNNRLPEETGVSVYYTWSDAIPGKSYMALSAGGRAYGALRGQKVWHSWEEYEIDARENWYKPYCKPLSIWTYSPEKPGINQFLVEENGNFIFFAVKESGGAEADSIVIKRWPLDLAGTDAVKENSWTGREDVEYNWKEGGLTRLSRGSFLAEPGYLYSIFVNWGVGWDEFSFTALQAWYTEESTSD